MMLKLMKFLSIKFIFLNQLHFPHLFRPIKQPYYLKRVNSNFSLCGQNVVKWTVEIFDSVMCSFAGGIELTYLINISRSKWSRYCHVLADRNL